MIRSMTGFGRAGFEVAGVGFSLEIRTVNHRYLDTRVRLPRLVTHCEHQVKTRVQERLRRGRVDVTVSLVAETAGAPLLEIDREVVERYVTAAREMARTHGLSDALDAGTVLSLPGVARMVERALPEEVVAEALLGAVEEALDAVTRMRSVEGESLARELAFRLETVELLLRDFEERSGRVVEVAKEKLRKRTVQLELDTGLLDEARLHQEIVLAADRLDIIEEVVRLRSHLEQFRAVLDRAGPDHPAGRRLDFLLQEMGREANTIGSKANDPDLSHGVVELKTELERLREQVQNVE